MVDGKLNIFCFWEMNSLSPATEPVIIIIVKPMRISPSLAAGGATLPQKYDVVVMGAGNAALSAALAAKEICGSVLVVEKAPEYFRGGNTYFTGGIIRFAFDGIEDIKTLIPDMSPTEEASVNVGSYTQDEFYTDMMRITQGLSDPELAQILVSRSLPTMQWLKGKDVRFVLSYGRQAFKDAGMVFRHLTGSSAAQDAMALKDCR